MSGQASQAEGVKGILEASTYHGRRRLIQAATAEGTKSWRDKRQGRELRVPVRKKREKR